MIRVAKDKIKNREDTMNNIQKLQAFVDEEKKNGLIDIKLFPSENVIRKLFTMPEIHIPPFDLEVVAGELLTQLTGPWQDITNQSL